MIKQSLWGLAIVLLALARTCAGDAPSSAQPVGVGSSQSLMLALNDPTVSTITLNGTIRLQRSAWREGEVVISSGRHVSLTRTGDQTVVMLDMSNVVDAIHVSSGATLELVNITLTNPASAASVQMTKHTRYVAPWSPSWPTITIEPNATIVKTSTMTYTWSTSADACNGFRDNVANILGPYNVLKDLTFPTQKQEITHLSGSHNLTQPVIDMVSDRIVGYMTSQETDTRTLCLPLPSDNLVGNDAPGQGTSAQANGASGQSSGARKTQKRVIALAAGLGALAAISIVAVLALIYSHMRYRRRVCQVLRERSDKDPDGNFESGGMGLSCPVAHNDSFTTGFATNGLLAPRSPFEDMTQSLVSDPTLRSAPSMAPKEHGTSGSMASFVTAQESTTSTTHVSPPGTPQNSGSLSEDSAPGAIELALLPSGTASTPVTSERTQQASFPWAMQQRPASFSGGATALQRSVSGSPPVPRALTNGRASAPVEALTTSQPHPEVLDLTDPPGPACPPSPFMASAAPHLAAKAQLTNRQLVKLAKQASLISRTSLCSVSSLVTRASAGMASQPVALRSPFERSPFDRALSGMLKRRTHSESCLVALNSSSAASEEPRSLQSTASIPEGSVAASEGSAQSGIDADLLSTMRFNDSAYAEDDHEALVTARAAHAQEKAQKQAKSSAPLVVSKKGPPAPAASVFNSMTSLPVSQHKPPVPVSTVKPVASTFDSVASMPAAQKLQPAPLKAPKGRAARLSPAASPRARRNSTPEADFTDLKFGALIGTGSFGRVYKGSWKGAVVAVKVIVHNTSIARKVDTLRESLVGISMQHPHVMTTYKVMTTMKASQLDEVPDERYSTARRNGYSVAHLGPGNATAQEMLETWLLLEYCDGGPLDQAIKNSRFKRSMGSILLSLMDIASGMEYLHSLGIVHSDLKGANVLIKNVKATEEDPRGYVCKLADFGLARVLGSNRTHVSTSTHGTVSYQPMEVLHDGRVTRSSDVYSFGMIMLEMFTGVAVFDGYSSSQILYQVFNGVRPAMPENLPQPYKTLITACWEKDPEHRPSFTEVHEKLGAMYRALPACQRPVLAAAPKCGMVADGS